MCLSHLVVFDCVCLIVILFEHHYHCESIQHVVQQWIVVAVDILSANATTAITATATAITATTTATVAIAISTHLQRKPCSVRRYLCMCVCVGLVGME